MLGLLLSGAAAAQAAAAPPVPPASSSPAPAAAAAPAPPRAALQLNLTQALALARRNSPLLAAAVTAQGLARQSQARARDAFLPSLNLVSQYLYTQGDGRSFPRFIANNAVHEYLTEGNVHEDLFTGGFRRSRYGVAAALRAQARAQAQIARRGLRLVVIASYYGLAAAEHAEQAALAAQGAAQRFVRVSRQLQRGGEVAESDVVKAELQAEQSDAALRQARLATRQSELALAVLLFPNWNQRFTIVDNLNQPPRLAPLNQAQRAALRMPQVASARAALRAAREATGIAGSAYWPTLSLDYFYGLDANHFAMRSDGLPNVGSSALASLTWNLWNWGATHSRVISAKLQARLAARQLRYVEQQAQAQLAADYAAARAAWRNLRALGAAERLAERSLRLTMLRYHAGAATALEVVNAQQSLLQARQQHAAGELNYRVTRAQLELWMGRSGRP